MFPNLSTRPVNVQETYWHRWDESNARRVGLEATALTAELQARNDQKVKHSKPQVTNPECIR